MIQRWKSWIEVQEQYLNKDQGKPTLVIDWDDMTQAPPDGSARQRHPRDMVMDVVLKKPAMKDAARRGRRNQLEDLLKSKGYLK